MDNRCTPHASCDSRRVASSYSEGISDRAASLLQHSIRVATRARAHDLALIIYARLSAVIYSAEIGRRPHLSLVSSICAVHSKCFSTSGLHSL